MVAVERRVGIIMPSERHDDDCRGFCLGPARLDPQDDRPATVYTTLTSASMSSSKQVKS